MIRLIKPEVILDSPLLKEYAEECAIGFLGEIDPDRALYRKMDEAQILSCFGVYHGEDLTGFATMLLTVYPHYSKKVATVESLYLKGAGGADLLLFLEQFACESKCSAIMYSAPVGGRLERLMDAKKSFTRTSTVFGKSLA